MAMSSSSCTTEDLYLFVTCGEGLEPLLIEELAELGFTQTRAGFRGIYVYHQDKTAVYRINYASRIASRVLFPLKKFSCLNRNDLYTQAKEIDWDSYIPKGKTIAIDANVSHNQLTNSLFAAQVVKDAICDKLREQRGVRPFIDPKEPDVQLNLFIRERVAIISFDTSGKPLHKRGYRKQSVEAPIQQSLAAALLRIAKLKENEIIYDPCCGSGTLLIEAALIASKTPPGYLRKTWGFMHLPDYSEEVFLKVKTEEDQKRIDHPNLFYGSDSNEKAILSAQENIKAAGLMDIIKVTQADFRTYQPAITPTLIIANPPHGKRLDEVENLRSSYRALGNFIKKQTSKPGRGFIFTSSLELAKEVGLAPKRRHVLKNGALESRLLEYDLY